MQGRCLPHHCGTHHLPQRSHTNTTVDENTDEERLRKHQENAHGPRKVRVIGQWARSEAEFQNEIVGMGDNIMHITDAAEMYPRKWLKWRILRLYRFYDNYNNNGGPRRAGGSHLSEVTLQPVYRAPRLLLWNKGPSWRGRREPVWSEVAAAPRRGRGGVEGEVGLSPGAA